MKNSASNNVVARNKLIQYDTFNLSNQEGAIRNYPHFCTLRLWRKKYQFRKKETILRTVIVTNKFSLKCYHRSANSVTAVVHHYKKIRNEMQTLNDYLCGSSSSPASDQLSESSMIQIDGNSIFLILCLVAINVGAVVAFNYRDTLCSI